MSYYRNRLQEAMLRKCKMENVKCKVVEVASRHRNSTFYILNSKFYTLLEAVAYAAFLSGWLVAIVTHL